MNDKITLTYSHRESFEEINKLVNFPIKIKDGKICYTSHLGETEEIDIVSQTPYDVTAVADITFVEMFYGDIESYIFTPKFAEENPDAHVCVVAKYDAYKIYCEYSNGRPRNYFGCSIDDEPEFKSDECIRVYPSLFMVKPFNGFISCPIDHDDDYEIVWLTKDYLDKFGHKCTYPLHRTAPYTYIPLTSTAPDYLIIRFLEAGLRYFCADIVPVSGIQVPEMTRFRVKLSLYLTKEEYENINFDGNRFVFDGIKMTCLNVTNHVNYMGAYERTYVAEVFIENNDITWADIHKLKKYMDYDLSDTPVRLFSVLMHSGDAVTRFKNYRTSDILEISHRVEEEAGVPRTNWWFNLGSNKSIEPNNETHCVTVKGKLDKLNFSIDKRYEYNTVTELPLHYSFSVPSDYSDSFYIQFINMVSVLGFENIVFRKLTLEKD